MNGKDDQEDTGDRACWRCRIRKALAGGLMCAACLGLLQYGSAVRPGTTGHPAAGGVPTVLADPFHTETQRGGSLTPWGPETHVTGSTTPTTRLGPYPGGL